MRCLPDEAGRKKNNNTRAQFVGVEAAAGNVAVLRPFDQSRVAVFFAFFSLLHALHAATHSKATAAVAANAAYCQSPR